jgi:hypothetical protein
MDRPPLTGRFNPRKNPDLVSPDAPNSSGWPALAGRSRAIHPNLADSFHAVTETEA